MPIKQTEIQEVMTQLVLLNEQFSNLKTTVEKSVGDHETRLRNLESQAGDAERDLATIRERMTVFNLMQGTLTAAVGTITYWLAKR